MKELIENLLSKYGLGAIFGTLIAVIIVWFAGHNMSSPGERVVVFWGLVEYTKIEKPDSLVRISDSEVVESSPPEAISNEEINQKVAENRKEPVSIEVRTVSEAEAESSLIKLREKYELRALNPLESGKKLEQTPKGVFVFTLLGWLDFWRGDFESEIKQLAVSSNSNKFEVELHKSKDNTLYMVGFISNSHAAEISQLDGDEKKEVVFSEVWDPEFNSLVRIPTSRVLVSEGREIDISNNKQLSVLDIEVQ